MTTAAMCPDCQRTFLIDAALDAHRGAVHAVLDSAAAMAASGMATKTSTNEAPYKIAKRDGKICVVNNANMIKATFTDAKTDAGNRAAALDYMRALYANVPGAAAAAGRKKWTGKQKAPARVSQAALDAARAFTAAARKKAAGSGAAMPDGSYPVTSVPDLHNAIQAFGRAKNKAAVKAHIIRRARALGATTSLPNGWGSGDKAAISCPEHDCARIFVDLEVFSDHAEAVHTFDEIRSLVLNAAREAFSDPASLPGDDTEEDDQNSGGGMAGGMAGGMTMPPMCSVWVQGIAGDWVVLEISEPDGDTDLYKTSYVIDANGQVTFGGLQEVVQRTVYDPVPAGS